MGVAEIRAAAEARRAGKVKPADEGNGDGEKKSQPQDPPANEGEGGEKNE